MIPNSFETAKNLLLPNQCNENSPSSWVSLLYYDRTNLYRTAIIEPLGLLNKRFSWLSIEKIDTNFDYENIPDDGKYCYIEVIRSIWTRHNDYPLVLKKNPSQNLTIMKRTK